MKVLIVCIHMEDFLFLGRTVASYNNSNCIKINLIK